MVLLLGTVSVGVLLVLAVSHHRARNRWVSPYGEVASAFRHVTRTEGIDFRPTNGLVGLRPAPVARGAQVVELSRHRAARAGHPAAV